MQWKTSACELADAINYRVGLFAKAWPEKKTIVLYQRGALLGPKYIWPMSCESNF